jgi:hypothetical protein
MRPRTSLSSPLLSCLLFACSGDSGSSGPATEGSEGSTDTAGSTDPATESASTDETGESEGGEPACEPPAEVISLGECNPLDPSMCALPFPSLFHARPDASTPSGYRLAFGPGSLPVNASSVPWDPTLLNEKDGFSTLTPLLAYFEGVSLQGVIGHEDLAAYLAADAKTVLLDAETGERVPHFVELDRRTMDASQSLLSIYPVTPLRHGRRYVVGIRGLVRGDGSAVAVSPGFEALRGCGATTDPDVLGQRAHYEEAIFPALAAAGFARGELQLAWDFVTVSRENSLGRMEWMRADLLAAIGEGGPKYTIKSVTDEECGPDVSIGRTIIVDMTAPRYTVEDGPDTFLTRDAEGMPYRIGETTVETMLRIPCSLITAKKPGRIVQYGHGLLGGYGEAKGGYLSKMADENGWVILASNWTGMKSEDTLAIASMLIEDVSRFSIIPERSMQGFVELMAALQMARGDLAKDDAVTFDGVSVIDPTLFSYYGNSQGGILGGAYLAASPVLERGVLGVGGMPYALLLPRSADFDQFFTLLKSAYPDQRDVHLLLGVIQVLWDPGETSGWAWAMNKEPGPGVPAKDVLLQVAIGDAQVTTLGAHIMARAFDAKTVAEQTRPVFGVEEAKGGFQGSALVEWLYTDVPDEPVENLPPQKSSDTHECPRREPAAQEQLRDFLVDGVVNQYCEGPCVGLRADTCG